MYYVRIRIRVDSDVKHYVPYLRTYNKIKMNAQIQVKTVFETLVFIIKYFAYIHNMYSSNLVNKYTL